MKLLIFFCSLTILFAGACKPAASDPEKTNANPMLAGSIDVKTAKRLIKNFEPRCYRPADKRLGWNESRCVWFSKEQLLTLLDKVKTDSCDGVRFYFATYDKDSMPSKEYTNDNYRDHSTLIMVTTRDSIGKHRDYFGQTENRTNRGAIVTADPQNQGEMCPPPQTCSLEGVLLLGDQQP